MYYKITVEFPDPRKSFAVTDTLKTMRHIVRDDWYKLEGCLDDSWSQVLGIYRPQISAGYDDDVIEQLLGAYNAWSSYLLDNLTPNQVGMIWAHDGGRYTVEEVQA